DSRTVGQAEPGVLHGAGRRLRGRQAGADEEQRLVRPERAVAQLHDGRPGQGQGVEVLSVAPVGGLGLVEAHETALPAGHRGRLRPATRRPPCRAPPPRAASWPASPPGRSRPPGPPGRWTSTRGRRPAPWGAGWGRPAGPPAAPAPAARPARSAAPPPPPPTG